MSLRDLDASAQYGYPVNRIARDQANALFAAAAAHVQAMTPSTVDERHLVLLALRASTIVRNESAREADASFRMLRAHLEDVPIDILQSACHAYVNAPGPRHYPRSAGELRTFTNPLMRQRSARAILLERLAQQAAEMDEQRQRLEADPCTPEDCARIRAEFGLDAPLDHLAKPVPTIQDYLDHGCTPAEARKAMREQKRLLARSGPPPIGKHGPPYARAQEHRSGAGRGEGEGAGSRGASAHAGAEE